MPRAMFSLKKTGLQGKILFRALFDLEEGQLDNPVPASLPN